MKKGSWILLTICACSLCVLLGMFMGRNMRGHSVILPANIRETGNAEDFVKADFRIDINTATERQLMDLPGIGETMANRIIDYRTEHGPFQSIDDLIEVDGIGDKTLQSIQTLIKAGG